MKSILSDIFGDNGRCRSPTEAHMQKAISQACSTLNIQATDYFAQKVYQLYEMLHIRPGVMIIGDSFAGKTTAYRILTKALSDQNTEPTANPAYTIINPKSVTIGQLYGEYDGISHEWRDGILAINFKQFINANDNCRKWIIFDGPVDTLWMENINSVLDDNRKLCLISGDIFHLKNAINFLFETMDLADASPAIVMLNRILTSIIHTVVTFNFAGFSVRNYLHVVGGAGLASVARIVEGKIAANI